MLSSHRIKSQEKKLVKRVFITVVTIIALCMFSIYIGLPILAKTIVLLSSFRKDTTTNTTLSDASVVFPPVLNPLPEATNSAKIVVSGSTQADTTVKLKLNDNEELKITPDKDGKFKSKTITLRIGENKIVASAIKKNSISDEITPVIIQYLKDNPKLEITYPKDGDKITSDNPNITMTGTTDSANTLTINDRFVIVNGNGKYSFDTKLSNGDNEYKFVVTDPAGNKTTQEIKFSYHP